MEENNTNGIFFFRGEWFFLRFITFQQCKMYMKIIEDDIWVIYVVDFFFCLTCSIEIFLVVLSITCHSSFNRQFNKFFDFLILVGSVKNRKYINYFLIKCQSNENSSINSLMTYSWKIPDPYVQYITNTHCASSEKLSSNSIRTIFQRSTSRNSTSWCKFWPANSYLEPMPHFDNAFFIDLRLKLLAYSIT
jgi:hypothetical protein